MLSSDLTNLVFVAMFFGTSHASQVVINVILYKQMGVKLPRQGKFVLTKWLILQVINKA